MTDKKNAKKSLFNNDKLKNGIVFFVIILLFAGFLAYGFYNKNNSSVLVEQVAQCLSETDAILYGTLTCPHCIDQKNMFGEYVSKIEFVNCEQNLQECLEKGVNAYPTWIINGRSYVGTRDLKTLYNLAECTN